MGATLHFGIGAKSLGHGRHVAGAPIGPPLEAALRFDIDTPMLVVGVVLNLMGMASQVKPDLLQILWKVADRRRRPLAASETKRDQAVLRIPVLGTSRFVNRQEHDGFVVYDIQSDWVRRQRQRYIISPLDGLAMVGEGDG